MDIIKKFGEMVGSTSLKDAKKARKLLLLGYQHVKIKKEKKHENSKCSRSSKK